MAINQLNSGEKVILNNRSKTIQTLQKKLYPFCLATEMEAIETELAAIIPDGAGLAYALDENGELVGLKLGLRKIKEGVLTDKFFEWLYGQASLQRLVIVAHDWELPEGISNISGLQYLCIPLCSSLPKDIIDLQLPFSTDQAGPLSPFYFRRLINRGKTTLSTDKEGEHSEDGKNESRRQAAEGKEKNLVLQLNKDPSLKKSILAITGIFVNESLKDPPLEIVNRGREAVGF
ncbi:hypothetical protein [Crocosphaera sp.]|uniref:hypothetical protein n=1 Tax=Crocosphaera sp. TaxID=2729996 RepID=UPI00260DA073|nr:hypothetical protein [Crocosphaera sp.]MDJ0579707.1 hypothetical protein [Crocosphaera sp.]